MQIAVAGMAENIPVDVGLICQILRKNDHLRIAGNRDRSVDNKGFHFGMCLLDWPVEKRSDSTSAANAEICSRVNSFMIVDPLSAY